MIIPQIIKSKQDPWKNTKKSEFRTKSYIWKQPTMHLVRFELRTLGSEVPCSTTELQVICYFCYNFDGISISNENIMKILSSRTSIQPVQPAVLLSGTQHRSSLTCSCIWQCCIWSDVFNIVLVQSFAILHFQSLFLMLLTRSRKQYYLLQYW